MPISTYSANRAFDALITGTLWFHAHVGRPSAANSVSGSGYGPVSIAEAEWLRTTVSGRRRIATRVPKSFPTPGGTWTAIDWVGLWSKRDLTDDPSLIDSRQVDGRVIAMVNGSVQIPVGGFFLELEIGD